MYEKTTYPIRVDMRSYDLRNYLPFIAISMTTKEKAEELLHKFQQVEVSAMYTDEDNDVCIASDKMYTIPSIQCAIITVEEIIAEHKSMPVIKHMRVIYWIQVLTELKAMQ